MLSKFHQLEIKRSHIKQSVAMFATLVFTMAAPSFSKAAVFNVREAGDVAGLIRAIEMAEANGEDDRINVAAGTYTLTKVNNEDSGPNGLPSIGTNVTINGAVFTGDGTSVTTIERQEDVDDTCHEEEALNEEEFRIFDVTGGNLILTRIRIQGGGGDCGAVEFGGGILNRGTLQLVNAIVTKNRAGGNGGGGISNFETAILTDSTVSDNAAGGFSGGIDNLGILNLVRSTVSGNRGLEVGGIENSDGTLSAVNSTISNNISSQFEATVGGIRNTSDPGSIVNLRFVTIADNRPGPGIRNGSDGATVTLSNSILARNGGIAGGETFKDCEGTITSEGFNLVKNTTGCDFTPTTGDQLNVGAGLRVLEHNGGPTETHALLAPSSPPIDAGDNTNCPATDQRGRLRPAGQGCDIGSFERGAIAPLCNGQPATIVGTENKDLLTGTPGPDIIRALAGNDIIRGFAGDDIICGGDGDDLVRGNLGIDTCKGGPGVDKFGGCEKIID